MLHGRAAELRDIRRLLTDARAGRSSFLVIQGEAGSGKTALLEQVANGARDFRVLRCTGAESEAELPFAGLHLLLLDCLDCLDALPVPQTTALRAAFGNKAVERVYRARTGGGGPRRCREKECQSAPSSTTDAAWPRPVARYPLHMPEPLQTPTGWPPARNFC